MVGGTHFCLPFSFRSIPNTYFILRRKFSVANPGAIATADGPVSAVTFVTAVSFLEIEHIPSAGICYPVMALMEVSSIIIGVLLMSYFQKEKNHLQISKVC